MGAGSSLPELEPLSALSSATPLEEAQWQAIFAIQLPSSSTDDIASASHALCAEMERNNADSGNFQALIRRVIDILYLVCRPKAPAAHVHQASSLVFLLRLFLKHMIETQDAEGLAAHLLDPSSAASLAGPLVQALLTVLVQCECNDESYWLHMEAVAALCVCLSTQMFAQLDDPTPQPFVHAALTSGGPGAELLVSRLLHYIIQRPQPPIQPSGLLRRLSSAAKSVLLLPYYTISYLLYAGGEGSDSDHALALSDRALQLLLLLTQHLPPALFSPESYQTNPFLEALRDVGDERPFDDAAAAAGGAHGEDASAAEGSGAIVAAEQGQLRASRVSFKDLHDALASQLPDEGSALLLYLLLHGNRDYLDYSLSRTDPEMLLAPLLRVLYDSRSLPVNRLYMLLILLLMLSQDSGFMSAAQKAMLASVPWYKDRIIGSVSVGSLMVMVLVKAVQSNLTGAHDAYVHTNCLAALANVAPLLRQLHPHAARCLVSLFDLLARKYLKVSRKTAALANAAEGGGGAAVGDSGRSEEGGDEEGAEALQMAVDFLRISLEAINLCLSAGPALNEHLVYALLERQAVFAPLRTHELFADLIENIDLVLEHFGATLRAHPDGTDGGDSVWSVDTVLSHIRAAARDWRGDQLRQLQDLRFTYEQEPAPEEFFAPYMWSIVFASCRLGWNAEHVVMFSVAEGGASAGLLEHHEAGEGTTSDGLPIPALSSIDVADDGAGRR